MKSEEPIFKTPPVKTSAVIFDCDGVMFDSRQANIHFYNHILQHFGLPPMIDEKVSFVHMHTADESIREIFAGTPFVDQAQAYRWKIDYTPFIRDMIMEPGLKELLDLLKPRFGLAVATNRSNTIGRVLSWNALESYFDIVVSSLDVKNPKPHPESLLKILDFFAIGPDEAFYVGDSLVDYETAGAAAVPFIAYKNRTLHAAHHVDHLMEVADIVLG
jgi:phosphoglycolate phosphatase-like HAD superfamily hydrolase